MSYDRETSKLSRTPVTLVVITLDFCALTYGVLPCTATGGPGEECYNTFPTCQDKQNYDRTTKEYRFTSLDAPYIKDARPYLDTIDWMQTEIKPGSLTIIGRSTLTMADEPDTDIGIDPYVENRSSVQGTFWKKLLARNKNYSGRRVEIYKGYTVEGSSVFITADNEIFLTSDGEKLIVKD
jgi:hypothetical protein